MAGEVIMVLKRDYRQARCCFPRPPDPISGYFSHNNLIVVHKSGCANLEKVEPARLLSLRWDEILEEKEHEPEEDYLQLEELDFRILKHHQDMGIDYSLMVAGILGVHPREVFDRHKKLRGLKLLKRVEKTMIRYRRNVVDSKWIKHRNHTYYEITAKGQRYLNHFVSQQEKRG